jgi:hypothetical protein
MTNPPAQVKTEIITGQRESPKNWRKNPGREGVMMSAKILVYIDQVKEKPTCILG